MIAISNNVKFADIKECKYSAKRAMAPIHPKNITEQEKKQKEEKLREERGISGTIIFEEVDEDWNYSADESFDVIIIDENRYIILLDVTILNEGYGLSVKDIEPGEQYTFVANPKSRV